MCVPGLCAVLFIHGLGIRGIGVEGVGARETGCPAASLGVLSVALRLKLGPAWP